MEDDKGLDLRLGLVFGSSSSKSNEKGNVSVDGSPNDTDRTIKVLSDFRNFLNGGGYSSAVNDRSSWDQNAEDDEKAPAIGDKRKYVSQKADGMKKQETGAQNSDSHISITTDDDGSTADNEDVAESGAQTSRLISNTEEASSEASKELPASSLPPFSLQSARTKTMNAGIVSGYPHSQLPSLDNGSPWGVGNRPLLLNPYSGRPMSAPATNQGLSEGENPAAKDASSCGAAEDKTSNSFPSEYPSIRPGMAADLKFGGVGTSPNLPWVSTTGPGPNGQTISGVTYRFSANQIRIVCACHGLHMSPQDFIQHASDDPMLLADVQLQSTSNSAATT